MKEIKLVVFDMAGTTVKDNSEVEYCFAEACEATGLSVTAERIKALQGYAKREVFTLLWSEVLGEKSSDLIQNVDFSYSTFCEILEDHYRSNLVLPTDHCLETFEILQQNDIKIALNTGFYRKVANIILEKLGWLEGLNEDYVNMGGSSPVNVSLTPSEVPAGRPAPDMIFSAMAKLGIKEASQLIKVGDTPVDLLEGYNAGCLKSLAVTNGTHSYQQLADCKNDGLLNSLQDLPRFLDLDVQKENQFIKV